MTERRNSSPMKLSQHNVVLKNELRKVNKLEGQFYSMQVENPQFNLLQVKRSRPQNCSIHLILTASVGTISVASSFHQMLATTRLIPMSWLLTNLHLCISLRH